MRVDGLRLLAGLVFVALVAGCGKKVSDPAAEAPPKADVVHAGDVNQVKVDNPGRFALVTATERSATSTLNVTGTVNPDISRTIPVISLANGRVVELHARLGDFVKKGQLLMEVQSTDVSGAFAQYLKASNDERLANIQYERAKILYDKGAIPKSTLEIAETSEQDARADLTAAEQQLKVLGLDKDNPAAAVKIYAPASGVIISQNVTNAAAAGVGLSGSSTAFTIADLSHVWVICDVYENDLGTLHLGQTADIHLSAYPQRALQGKVSDIGAVLDPALRTAKVRIQVENPGMLMRVGMFATATIHGQKTETRTVVPATAVLHLQDRDWVYLPQGGGNFKRAEVRSGVTLPDGTQEVSQGLQPGQQVVMRALDLQNTAAQ